jgi:hypothetical protein
MNKRFWGDEAGVWRCSIRPVVGVCFGWGLVQPVVHRRLRCLAQKRRRQQRHLYSPQVSCSLWVKELCCSLLSSHCITAFVVCIDPGAPDKLVASSATQLFQWCQPRLFIVVSAAASSGCSAVLACVSCICLRASMAGGSHSALHVSANSSFTTFPAHLLANNHFSSPANHNHLVC